MFRLSQEKNYTMIIEKYPCAKEIAVMSQLVNLKKLLLTHMRSHMDTELNHLQMKKEMKENFSGESGISEDLMIINL